VEHDFRFLQVPSRQLGARDGRPLTAAAVQGSAFFQSTSGEQLGAGVTRRLLLASVARIT
jgi:hypothetical protein